MNKLGGISKDWHLGKKKKKRLAPGASSATQGSAHPKKELNARPAPGAAETHTLSECPACQARERLCVLALPSRWKLTQGPVGRSLQVEGLQESRARRLMGKERKQQV